jgi:hypothetical protein
MAVPTFHTIAVVAAQRFGPPTNPRVHHDQIACGGIEGSR